MMMMMSGTFWEMTSRRSSTSRSIPTKGFMCRVSVVESYHWVKYKQIINQKSSNLFIFFNISDISLHAVQSTQECEELMEKGWGNRYTAKCHFLFKIWLIFTQNRKMVQYMLCLRATGATKMNADSSRSHLNFHFYSFKINCKIQSRSHSIFTINIEMMATGAGDSSHIRKVSSRSFDLIN